MQRAIQLAGFHYIACMKARPSNSDHKLTIDKSSYTFEAIRTANSNELHAEFQMWATATVLRDLIESFSIFLTEVYEAALAANPQLEASTTPARFERMGIEDQLAVLAKDFSINNAWIDRLTGYNRARNCLAHRMGLVGVNDATEGGELVIRWLRSSAELTDGLPSPILEVEGAMSALVRGEHVSGGAARMRIDDREKRFPVGRTIRLLPDELLEICGTFQLAVAAVDGLSRPAEPIGQEL